MKVAFLGPDGVGKSTIINKVIANLDNNDMEVTYHYLVPGFLPKYRNVNNGAPVTNPHASVAHGTIKSFIKLTYWLMEYHLGSVFIDNKNRIMIFDRYYYDVVVDPKRYCCKLPKNIMNLFCKLAPKPDLLVILDATTCIIQSRKKEVSFDETERQRLLYLQLENKLCPSIIVDTTLDIEENVHYILSIMKSLNVKV